MTDRRQPSDEEGNSLHRHAADASPVVAYGRNDYPIVILLLYLRIALCQPEGPEYE